jgi:hypothetical protein
MPDLVRVVSPGSEVELAGIVEMLEAHEIPCFVCDARLGSVSSGVHVRTPQTLMVPGTRLAEAAGLIEAFRSSRAAHDDGARNRLSSRLSALIRFIWFVCCRPVARTFK